MTLREFRDYLASLPEEYTDLPLTLSAQVMMPVDDKYFKRMTMYCEPDMVHLKADLKQDEDGKYLKLTF